MKSIMVLLAVSMMAAALSIPAFGQQTACGQQTASDQQTASNAPVSRVVHSGHLDILVVENATGDLNLSGYRAFQQFADEHPQIAGALGNQPTLIYNRNYLEKHPDLARFLEEHPDIRADFSANPRNYAVGAQARAESYK
jgi:hypothetical protein